MKLNLFFAIFFLCVANISFSQDTIVKRNNTIVLAKILEITTSEVKYKRQDMLDGPVYTELKNDITMVKYANGLKEEFAFQPVPKTETGGYSIQPYNDIKITQRGHSIYYMNRRIGTRELLSLLHNSPNKDVFNLQLKSEHYKQLSKLGFIAIPLGAVAVGSAFVGMFAGSGELMLVSGGCALVAIPFVVSNGVNVHKSARYRQDAINAFNK
jgi:hypothetical protein